MFSCAIPDLEQPWKAGLSLVTCQGAPNAKQLSCFRTMSSTLLREKNKASSSFTGFSWQSWQICMVFQRNKTHVGNWILFDASLKHTSALFWFKGIVGWPLVYGQALYFWLRVMNYTPRFNAAHYVDLIDQPPSEPPQSSQPTAPSQTSGGRTRCNNWCCVLNVKWRNDEHKHHAIIINLKINEE